MEQTRLFVEKLIMRGGNVLRRICVITFVLVVATTLTTDPVAARTWLVPDDAPTVKAGIDSASAGDVVEVACGHYVESNIVLKPGIVLRSATGQYDCATLENQNPIFGYVVGFWFTSGSATVVGFTITGGLMTDEYFGISGAGIDINGSDAVVRNCLITGNEAFYGGGVEISGGHAVFENCIIQDNTATFRGGGVRVLAGGSLTAVRCIIGGNAAPECPDGTVSGEAILACSDFTLDGWCAYGDLIVIEDEWECDALPTENFTWGGVKALYK
jgi:hypothetical protein